MRFTLRKPGPSPEPHPVSLVPPQTPLLTRTERLIPVDQYLTAASFFKCKLLTEDEKVKHIADIVTFKNLFTNALEWGLANSAWATLAETSEGPRRLEIDPETKATIRLTHCEESSANVIDTPSSCHVGLGVYIPLPLASDSVPWPQPKATSWWDGQQFIHVIHEKKGKMGGWLPAGAYAIFKKNPDVPGTFKRVYWRDARLWCYEIFRVNQGCKVIFREHRLFCEPLRDGERIPGIEHLDQHREEAGFPKDESVAKSVAKRVYEPLERVGRVEVLNKIE